LPRELMVPPGVPDFMTRMRFVEPSMHVIEGRAWSGQGAIVKVELSDDGGATWSPASLEAPLSPYAWRRWRFGWDATRPGEYELCVRATDEAGEVQARAMYLLLASRMRDERRAGIIRAIADAEESHRRRIEDRLRAMGEPIPDSSAVKLSLLQRLQAQLAPVETVIARMEEAEE